VSLEAGGAAVRLAGHTPTGCENDLLAREHSACQVLELLGVLPQVWRQHALRAAEQYLREHWRTVERVAMALRNEGTLPQERLLELVGELPFPEMRELFGALDYWEQRAAARRAAS
jgi:hypothetical protein